MNINRKRDGHVHTPFCPHGSNDTYEMYIEEALKNGLNEITFAEHMPIPLEKDPSPRGDSCMTIDTLEKYLKETHIIKNKYKNKIKINVGVEVDYIEGKEKEIKELLDKYGECIDDSILSVHNLLYNEKYYPIGAGFEPLNDLVKAIGGMDKVYELYYETMLKSIEADLGKYKPKRIGHPTLVRKYKTDFPNEIYNVELLDKIARKIKEMDYEIDLNTSGTRKIKCNEVYPSGVFMELLKEYNVKMVLGSDAHSSKEIALQFNNYELI